MPNKKMIYYILLRAKRLNRNTNDELSCISSVLFLTTNLNIAIKKLKKILKSAKKNKMNIAYWLKDNFILQVENLFENTEERYYILRGDLYE